MFQTNNQTTHFVVNDFFFVENRTVYEIMWKSIVEAVRPQKTIWRMSIACCIPKVTQTQNM
jgi:hypothetical protein